MSKTQKRPSSPGPFSQNETLANFLDAESAEAYSRPWHRLDKGLRLNRLKAFAEKEGARLNLSDADQRGLYSVLQKALAKGNLTSKSTVIYDQEKQEIGEIKGLVMHRSAAGDMLFQIVEKKNAVTFRKQRVAGAGAADRPEKSDSKGAKTDG